jgi:G:T-mismatch repair DNA endonuclease (very short patch repair protein)
MWMDYFPWAIGTVPEKMVFAELAGRGVTFFFAPYWGDMPFTEDVYEHYRPDFVLPEYRIVIEVYGTYWHTLPGASDRDARKAAMYESAGYHYYQLWDSEIYDNVAEAVDRIPELVDPAIRTGKIFVSDRPFDPTSSLRAQRRKAPKVIRLRVGKVMPRGLAPRPLVVQVPHLRAPRRPRAVREMGFHGFDPEYLAKLRTYSRQWKDYVDQLGAYFSKARVQRYYPRQYRWWARWKDWWDVWQKAVQVGSPWREYIGELGEYFERHPSAREYYPAEYYRWQSWRRRSYRLGQ